MRWVFICLFVFLLKKKRGKGATPALNKNLHTMSKSSDWAVQTTKEMVTA